LIGCPSYRSKWIEKFHNVVLDIEVTDARLAILENAVSFHSKMVKNIFFWHSFIHNLLYIPNLRTCVHIDISPYITILSLVWKLFPALSLSLSCYDSTYSCLFILSTISYVLCVSFSLSSQFKLKSASSSNRDAVEMARRKSTNESSSSGSGGGGESVGKWWDKGLLIAALVDSGGDARKAGRRLCVGNKEKKVDNKKKSKDGSNPMMEVHVYRKDVAIVSRVVRAKMKVVIHIYIYKYMCKM
jgi:hypothetical protein